MSEEISKYFTQEDFAKHLRFLTKEDFDTKLNDIKDKPNIFHKKDQILESGDLDSKFQQYIQEGNQMVEDMTAASQTYLQLSQNIAQKIGGNMKVEYSPEEPQDKDPNTFYLTDQLLNIGGVQLQYTADYDGLECQYYYTGSIEEATDSGLLTLDTGMQIIMVSNPEEQIRTLFVMDPTTQGSSLFKTEIKGSEGEFKRIEGAVKVNISQAGISYTREEKIGEPCFMVNLLSQDGSYLYGDFVIGDGANNTYCNKAVQVTFEDPAEKKEIANKIVGEHIQGFFTRGYSYLKQANQLTEFEQAELNRYTKLYLYEPNRVGRTYQLTRADYEKYGLNRIKNFEPENLDELKLSASNISDPSGGGLAVQILTLSHGFAYLDVAEVNHNSKFHFLLSLDSEDGDDHLDFLKIKEEAPKIQERAIKTNKFGIRQKGLIINVQDPSQIGRYVGQTLDKAAHGRGQMKHEKQYSFAGTFENGQFLEGELNPEAGGRMIGKFVNNQLNDLNGKIVYIDGSVYEGQVENQFSKGKGKLTYANGGVYEGEFDQGTMHGLGKMTFKSGDVYSGQFNSHLIDGEGELRRPNGEIYTGKFNQNLVYGNILTIEGKLIRPDGGQQEGSFSVNLEDIGGNDGTGGGVGGSGGGGIDGGSQSGGGGATLSMMRFWGLWSPLQLTPRFQLPFKFPTENKTTDSLTTLSPSSSLRVVRQWYQFERNLGIRQPLNQFFRKNYPIKFSSNSANISLNPTKFFLKGKLLPKPTALFSMIKRVIV